MKDSEYNAGPLVAIIAFFLAVTCISVLLRLYVRLRITLAFELDGTSLFPYYSAILFYESSRAETHEKDGYHLFA